MLVAHDARRGTQVYAPTKEPQYQQANVGSDFCLLRGMRRIPLIHAENLIGRAGNVTVVIDDTSIAQHHAAIHIKDGQATIQ